MMNNPIPSASHIRTNEVIFELITRPLDPSTSRVLDFGAGRGHMCQRIGTWLKEHGQSPAQHLDACEINPDAFRYSDINCQAILPDSVIPFPDASFDVIYSIEVMEHLPRPYDFIQNAWDKLKPGGRLIISVPNFLHLQSRIKLLFTGFGEMFGPPSANMDNAGRICGHIMPLSYGHLHYGLRRVGFCDIAHAVDRRKKGALIWYFLLFPALLAGRAMYQRQLQKYDRAVFEETKSVTESMNSLDFATSRSIILIASKPKS